MTIPLSSEINEALTAYADASVEELRLFTEATSRSGQFKAELATAMRMIAGGGCPTEMIWAAMVVMLWAGMSIERKRQEVAMLYRLHEKEAV